jgi:hypothetical protein
MESLLEHYWWGMTAMLLYVLGWLAYVCAASLQLYGLDLHVQVGDSERYTLLICGAAFYPPVITDLDRFSRYPGSIYG